MGWPRGGVPAGLPFFVLRKLGRMVSVGNTFRVERRGGTQGFTHATGPPSPPCLLSPPNTQSPLSKDKLVTEEEKPSKSHSMYPGGRRGEGEEVLEGAEVTKEGLSTSQAGPPLISGCGFARLVSTMATP